jgi:hypothetical protein
MRLNKFLNEELSKLIKSEIKRAVELIEKNVEKSFTDIIKSTNHFLYRGYSKNIDIIAEVKPRNDRKPKDTNKFAHEEMDNFFLKKFDWKARSNGVFTTPSFIAAEIYGYPCIFFPIGSYKFIWSPEVSDFYRKSHYFGSLDKLFYKEIDKKRAEEVEKIKNSYTDKNLKVALFSGRNEVMFKCESFYLFNIDYERELRIQLGMIKQMSQTTV